MKENKSLTRRNILKWTMGSMGVLASQSVLGQSAPMCGLTPAQPEGPFYPEVRSSDEDWDLTRVRGKVRAAEGTVVMVTGTVQTPDCRPVERALVEIWQACHTGRYNHSADTNTAALDPNFQYWGKYVTGDDGKFLFKTIIPGAYPASASWVRPAHIHCKVSSRGYHELTTQMYFEGDAYNGSDRILQELSEEEKEKVIIPFKRYEGQEYPIGIFNMQLKPVV